MTNINVDYELLWLQERHLGDMNKQLRLKLEAEGFNLKAMESLWSLTSAATNSNFTFQPSQTNNPMDCQPEPFLQIGIVGGAAAKSRRHRYYIPRLKDSFAGEANHGQPSRQEKKTMSSEDCLGWAARDASGHLSPYKFNRRDRLPQSDIHAV
ncbi:hypothetical protein S83_008786, partial [Arachis hypogaea]